MTIFIKPNATNTDTYFILAMFDETRPRLERIVFASTEIQIIEFLDDCNPSDDDRIYFDGSVYGQTGVDLRRATERHIYIYKDKHATQGDAKQSLSSQNEIIAQSRWIAQNMQYHKSLKGNADFSRFLQLIKDYRPTNPNCDPTAAELMAAAARIFRKQAMRNG